MKSLCSLILFIVLIQISYAQNKTFGVGTSTLNPNAALQVDATNQGLQLPRLTTAQRIAMTLNGTDKGLMVFDTDLNSIHTWSGGAWTNDQKLLFPYKDSLAINPAVGDAFFHLVNTSNQANADVIKGVMKGTGGAAGSFILRNAASSKPALYSETIGTGNAAFFKVNNATTGGTALAASTNSNVGGALAPVAVYGESTGTGSLGAAFWNTNSANTYPALYSRTLGTGNSARFEIVNASSGASAVQGETNGTGSAGVYGRNTNTTSTFGTGVTGEVNSTVFGIGVFGKHTGTSGFAGSFEIQNPANNGWGVKGSTDGTGSGVYGVNYGGGDGNAGFFEIMDAANTAPAMYSKTVGTGAAVSAESSTGFAALHGNAHGVTTAVSATTDGTSGAGYFEINNAGNGNATIFTKTNGPGSAITAQTGTGFAAVYGEYNGTANGHAGLFKNTAANSYPALQVEKAAGTGTAVTINHAGSTGDIILFTTGTFTPVARITKAGLGIFQAGTQTGGADLAELFDVEGGKQNYEPGDVLVISESTDRTVEKSSSSNSSRVAGVYATKPGVTLTERGIEESIEDLVPMGVIGVIPTKVCDENGPIKRGDLLVTSSLSGHAMKAKPVVLNGVEIYPTGAVLGKALENWEEGKGLIKVLVNVK